MVTKRGQERPLGGLFHGGGEPSSLMRVNFAAAQDAAFWRVCARVRSEIGA